MQVRPRRRDSGFWKGVATGLVVALIGTLALAWIFPPVVYTPPALPENAGEAPAAPNSPAPGPAAPLLPEAAGPLVPGAGPSRAGEVEPAAPVRDGAGNAPSLVPVPEPG